MSDSARNLFRKIISGKPAAPATPTSSPHPTQPTGPGQASPPVSPAPSSSDTTIPPLAERIKPEPTDQPASPESEPTKFSIEATPPPTTYSDARLFLQQLRGKMARLAEEFAQGKVNNKQFQEIYAHYQSQRHLIEVRMDDMPGADGWREAVTFGQTATLRQRNAAKVLSYAIYDNASSLPLASVGDFAIDTALLVPMLSSFRSATAEMFGAGLRSTEIEGGHWLCFVPGDYTTLFVIFSLEPARVQVNLIEDLHRDFEVANGALLENGQGDEVARQFTRLWALNRTTF